ncbi:cyclohexanone monooxygenase, partial [Enterococcus faecalis]
DKLQQEWKWQEKYAPQAEILRYIEHVAERFDLLKLIQFNTRIVSASFDDNLERWIVTTDRGESKSARYLILATGPLSTA